MKIYQNQLQTTLNQGFKPVWLIFGDEPWQKDDSLSQIRSNALQQGFEETLRFTADDKFDWFQLVDEYQSMSLFSNLRVIEIDLPTGKINDAGTKVIQSLTENMHQDVMLVFHGPKLDGASQKRKWFKTLEKVGCFIPLYDIEGKQLHQWLMRQANQLNLKLSPDLVPLLIELFEGNLLALSQELQKLSLLFGTNIITVEEAQKIVIKQAKFNPFQLIDAILLGELARCISMLNQLQQEGTAVGQLIWFVHKEINQLYDMIEKLAKGENINGLFKAYRIWDKRKPLYQHALNNITLENISLAQSRLAQVDLISKTTSDFDPFILLADVCTTLYHGDVTQALSLDYEIA